MEIDTQTIHCCQCGIMFVVTVDFYKRRKRDHATFYCPNGHPQHFPDKSDEDILREQLAEMESSRNAHKNNFLRVSRKLRATKAVVSRLKKGLK